MSATFVTVNSLSSHGTQNIHRTRKQPRQATIYWIVTIGSYKNHQKAVGVKATIHTEIHQQIQENSLNFDDKCSLCEFFTVRIILTFLKMFIGFKNLIWLLE
nr:unnamed protein product [Callosobruchus chinensis]